MESTGLLPGQRWRVEPGPLWQARLDRTAAAHVIGQGLAGHEGYAQMYLDADGEVTRLHADEWVTFRHACRMSRACLPHESEDDPADEQKAYDASIDEWDEALDAYRARRAQGGAS